MNMKRINPRRPVARLHIEQRVLELIIKEGMCGEHKVQELIKGLIKA